MHGRIFTRGWVPASRRGLAEGDWKSGGSGTPALRPTVSRGAAFCMGVGLVLALSGGLRAAPQLRTASTAPAPSPTGEAAPRPAYAVFIRERSRDTAELKTYAQKAPASLVGRAAKVLAAYGPQEALEGPAAEGVVIVQFPSLRAAKEWYASPAYREARRHRFLGADYRAMLVEGL